MLVSVAFVQLGFSLAVRAFDELSATQIVFVRFLLTGLVLSLVWRPHLIYLRREMTWWFAISLTGLFICFLLSLERLPQATTTTLAFLGPLTIALIGSHNKMDLLWVTTAAAGVVMLGQGELEAETAGIVLALLAAAFWALYILTLARLGEDSPEYGAISMANLIAALLTLPFVFVAGVEHLVDVPSVAFQVIAFSLLAGMLPLIAEFEALRRIPNHTFGVFMSLDPAFAALWGFVVLSQGLGLIQVIAIALVTIGSIGAFSHAPRPAAPAI